MNKIIVFFTFLLLTSIITAQNRGFTPVTVAGTGTTTLYKQSHALIIGMSNYTNGWPKLDGVKKDIPLVKDALEQNGFHVVVKMDLTREQLDKAFIDFITTYGQDPENRLVFYFAGHGHTLNNFGEVNGYIVPVDAPNPNYDKAGFIAKAMPMSRIEEYAKQAGSKHALFLFDACFSGSLFATSRAVPDIISYKTAEPVRQFITSGSADETVPDESIFRQQFVTALTTDYADANKDGYLTGTELGSFLQDNVVNYSRNAQHPQYGKIRNPYLDKGDFVFVLGNTQNNVTPPDPNVDNGQATTATGNLKLISDYTGTAKITSITGTQLQTKNVTEGGTYDFYS
ncbi:MAG: caspase family protein, partial [Bacteroidales bacterium]|nr:caspase family protein [Bacteroidales bacterium]